jgi:uncharacterized membrane protein
MFEYLDRKLHFIYIMIALVLGGCMAYLTPPGAIPDETSHMAKIATVSAGEWIGIPRGGLIPDIAEGYGNVPGKISARQLMLFSEEIRATFHRPLECSRETSEFHQNIIGYSPLPYFLAALNYKGMCALEATFGSFLYSSRLINLLASVLLVAVGIRFAGMGRWSLAVVGLMPMTLYMLPSISADSLMIAAAICYIGILSGAVSRGSVLARSELCLVVFSALLLGLSKPGAAWLLALVLVCYPVYQRAQKSFKPLLLMAGLLPLGLHLLMLRRGARYSMINTGGGADPAVNFKIILESPLHFLEILSNTYFYERGDDILRSLIGNLGWEDVPPTQLTICSVGAALFLSILLNTRSKQLLWGIGSRAYLLTLAVASLILLAMPLYVTWTRAGADWVNGLQGRYFIPTAALLLPSVGFYISRRLRDILAPLTLVLVVLGGISSMHSLYGRYYFDDAKFFTEWVPAQQHRTNLPVWLDQSEMISGDFSWQRAAYINGVGVLIGNAFNTADGLLYLQLCNESECIDAHRNLAESRDNKYLYFRFERPLLASSSSVLHYEFRLGGGTRPVALWSQATNASTGGMLLGVAQTRSALSPQFVVEYQEDL